MIAGKPIAMIGPKSRRAPPRVGLATMSWTVTAPRQPTRKKHKRETTVAQAAP